MSVDEGPKSIIVRRVMATSLMGFGTTFYGWRPATDGRHTVTLWATGLFFPIFPLGSYIINYRKEERTKGDIATSAFGLVRDVHTAEEQDLCWPQVWNTYLFVYLPLLIGFAAAPFVPDVVLKCFAGGIIASWCYAAFKMRRLWRKKSA